MSKQIRFFVVILVLFTSLRGQTSKQPSVPKSEITSRIVLLTGEFEQSASSSFKYDDRVFVRVTAINNTQRVIAMLTGNPFIRYVPLLLRNGEKYGYSVAAQQLIEKAKEEQRNSIWYSGPKIVLLPNVETQLVLLKLSDWYGQLEPGIYELQIELIVDKTPARSEPITFEIRSPQSKATN